MPAGVPWGIYLKFTSAAMLSMFTGAQLVHMYYKPLNGMEELVDEEVKKMRKELVDTMDKVQ